MWILSTCQYLKLTMIFDKEPGLFWGYSGLLIIEEMQIKLQDSAFTGPPNSVKSFVVASFIFKKKNEIEYDKKNPL